MVQELPYCPADFPRGLAQNLHFLCLCHVLLVPQTHLYQAAMRSLGSYLTRPLLLTGLDVDQYSMLIRGLWEQRRVATQD